MCIGETNDKFCGGGDKLNKWITEDRYLKFSNIVRTKKIFVYGMGNTTDLYQEGLKRIESILRIDGYCDGNVLMRHKSYSRKKGISPDELRKLSNVCVLVSVGRFDTYQAIKEHLDALEIENYSISEAVFSLCREEVIECYNLLEDELSKAVFEDAIDSFCSMRLPTYRDEGEEYFSLPCMENHEGKETFIDCGAYVGDTIDCFLASRRYRFDSIIAFEPDDINFKRCREHIDQLEHDGIVGKNRIKLYPYAVGETGGSVKIEHYATNGSDGLSSKVSNDGDEVKVISLDEFINTGVDFIKADIESYEYKMLLGAENTIKRNRPLLSICVYHSAMDLFQIPLLIKRFVPEYKFMLRHYGKDLSDYILYGYVE